VNASDPHVPISPGWLRAVMDRLDVSVAELAKRTAGSEQNIAHILKSGEGRTTRASRRTAFAKALGVSEHMLSGEAMYLPGMRAGYELRYSARTWLAAGALLTKCETAARRDIERLPARVRKTSKANAIPGIVARSVVDLLEMGSWRERFLRFDPPRHERQGYQEPLSSNIDEFAAPPVDDPAHEASVVAMARALEHILSPWFEGNAVFDYAALRELTFGTLPPHTGGRENPLAIARGQWVNTPRGHNDSR
jgi:hypothetical protein